MPSGCPSGFRVVITVTPVANRPSSWRKSEASTPVMPSTYQGEEGGRVQDPSGRNKIPGGPHQQVAQVGPAGQAAHHAAAERRPADAEADEPFQDPLAREGLAAA